MILISKDQKGESWKICHKRLSLLPERIALSLICKMYDILCTVKAQVLWKVAITKVLGV